MGVGFLEGKKGWTGSTRTNVPLGVSSVFGLLTLILYSPLGGLRATLESSGTAEAC